MHGAMGNDDINASSTSAYNVAMKRVAALSAETFNSNNKNWDSFIAYSHAVDELIAIETAAAAAAADVDINVSDYSDDMESLFVTLRHWLTDNDFPSMPIDFMSTVSNVGNGMRATRPIVKGEEIVTVPQRFMITSKPPMEMSSLCKLVKSDPLLSAMPSLVLAIRLLQETFLLKESFWSSYINVLPRSKSFSIPLYFSISEMKELKGSSVLNDAIRYVKNVGRQYVYIRDLLSRNTDIGIPANTLNFEIFRWAISVVMTRQNRIPLESGEVMALVPVWDMMNHIDGEMTTSFVPTYRSLVSLAASDYKLGEQVFMCYGPRPSSQLLLYSGFVPEVGTNPHDVVVVHQAISRSDRALSAKVAVLKMYGLSEAGDFELRMDPVLSPELFTHMRVAAINNEAFNEYAKALADDNTRVLSRNDVHKVMQKSSPSAVVDCEATKMLSNKCALIERMYPTTLEQDQAIIAASKKTATTSMNVLNCVKLRACEKVILRNAIEQLNTLEKQLR